MVNITYYDSKISRLCIASDGDSIIGLWFENQKYYMANIGAYIEKEDEVLKEAKQWLDAYFNNRPLPKKPKLKINGTAFQTKIYEELLKIDYGKTSTYKEIGENINCKAYRSIGRAIGQNSISILIPCHRVLGSNKSLTGFAAGLETKAYLLDLEAKNC